MIGTCLCGEVRFEVDGPYPKLYQCHCSLCRKQGGSTSNTGLVVAADKFSWLAGESLVTQRARSTGFRSWLCSRCGSPVPNPLRDTEYTWVPSELLDADERLQISAQLCVDSKAPWDEVLGPGERFEKTPDLKALIQLLHAGTYAQG
ncbi:MAG: GFA family protein [Steroidobacteraceae bacterium]